MGDDQRAYEETGPRSLTIKLREVGQQKDSAEKLT